MTACPLLHSPHRSTIRVQDIFRNQIHHTSVSRSHSCSAHNRRDVLCQTATLEELQVASEKYVWQGHDEFDQLDDRRDEAPMPLPELNQPKRVVLVRHGQSTWNAEGRVQGCCNISVLTEKGKGQADTTRQLVSSYLWHHCGLVSCCIGRVRHARIPTGLSAALHRCQAQIRTKTCFRHFVEGGLA